MTPPANLLLPFAALAMTGGLAAVFLAWRDRRQPAARRRPLLAAGWGLVGAGVVSWACAVPPDVGAAQAVAAAMVLALAAVGGHSLRLPAARKPLREVQTAASVAPPTRVLAVARTSARLAGSLAAAPAFGVLVGLAVMKWTPGAPATRLVALAFAAILAAAGGLVFVLASVRPIRAASVLTAIAAGLALLLALSAQVA